MRTSVVIIRIWFGIFGLGVVWGYAKRHKIIKIVHKLVCLRCWMIG